MRMGYGAVVVFMMVTSATAGAISWNPVTWFYTEQKKQEQPSVNHYWKTFQKSHIYAAMQQMQKTFHTAPQVQYARQHPRLVGMACAAVGITLFLRSFARLQATLQKNDAWAHWKHDVGLSSTKYDGTLTHELLHEIQVRYMRLHAITDFMGPIRSFMADSAKEKDDLQRYARYARWLQNCGLYCCVDTELVTQTDERIERIETLRALCVHWLAKTKLDPVLA